MTNEEKPFFEILNNFWSLLKPYVNQDDEKTYKKIMSDVFKLLVKDRGEPYTEEWWDSTKDMINYPDKYKKTKFVDFATDLVISIFDYWQHASKKQVNKCDFMIYVGKAFVYEWERLRND